MQESIQENSFLNKKNGEKKEEILQMTNRTASTLLQKKTPNTSLTRDLKPPSYS